MKPALLHIHHIAIIANDYAVSKRFYTEILGFEIVQEVYRAERNSYKCDLALNGTYMIELFSFPEVRPRGSQPEAAGLRHLALAVNDVSEWITYLRKYNVSVQDVRVDEYTGKKFTFFFDPNQQPLELYEV